MPPRHEGIYTERIWRAEQACVHRHAPGGFWSGYRALGCAAPNGTLLPPSEAELRWGRNYTSPPHFPHLLPANASGLGAGRELGFY